MLKYLLPFIAVLILGGCGRDSNDSTNNAQQIAGVWYAQPSFPITEDMDLEPTVTLELLNFQVDGVSFDQYWLIDADGSFSVYRTAIEELPGQPDQLRDCVTLFAVGLLVEEEGTYSVIGAEDFASGVTYQPDNDTLEVKFAPVMLSRRPGEPSFRFEFEQTFDRSDLRESELPICEG